MENISINDIKTINEKINGILETDILNVFIQNLAISDNVEDLQLFEIINNLKSALSIMRMLENIYEILTNSCLKELNYGELIKDLSKLGRMQEIANQVGIQYEHLRIKYLFFFNGIDTDWGRILDSLAWTNEFKKIIEKFRLSKVCVKNTCEDEKFITNAKQRLREITSKINEINTDLHWYFSLFDDKDELLTTNLHTFLTRLEDCSNSLSSLEEWIDFRSSREKCRDIGLSDYIEKIQIHKVNKETIVPAFLKRFYRLWLDAILPNYPAVYSFRRRTQDELIEEFKNLDKKQFIIAKSRIRQKLATKLPNLNQFSSAVDEVGVLKRELNKQRRFMPLRKLFREIPNLLLTLKPCLMMSPLSVSLFLNADIYKFDIVVFDEASQVCTEDAIGAILRGSQVIIAGDTNQLPPTNFFSASTSDSDFDNNDLDEDDYDDTDAYESVLDEAVTVLPERTLRWHYRSHHEHLIAFSNVKIYRNNLITFPSHINNEPNNGVEYIYVPDGVYDRSGKRNNINEANKVAELVFEHIQNFPSRSLGIVTFSEAQQQAVEMAIRQMRLENQQFETFFSEDREEDFFVKNLENVQGDERDTIIFSIGYAKDHNGVMHMNFGPLSKSGGYRRLNVAITRAKYNVKLVGSIEPTDIIIENTNSEGVKMLRSYIEFAKDGESVLQRELSIPDSIYTDSPFEDSIYQFLVSKGYSVATQVGCSGYRIDLAIKHPTLSGRFVIGIECDGASYHSARTARERDRLRQAVLEDNGWKIYRIWSTDWIKDPLTEGKKLTTAIDYAITSYNKNGFTIKKNENGEIKTTKEFSSSIEVPIKGNSITKIDNNNPYNFDYYVLADIKKVRRSNDDIQYLTDILRYVIEQEYPIHFELLCKRATYLFGNQKATVKIRRNVKYIINGYLQNEVIFRNGFYWPKRNSKIKVRISNSPGTERKLEYICSEEIAEAMFVISGHSFGIKKSDLFVATARAFGFNRTGGHIVVAMETAFDLLIGTGRVDYIDEKVIIKPNS